MRATLSKFFSEFYWMQRISKSVWKLLVVLELQTKVVFTVVLRRLHVPFALELKRTGIPRELHGDCVTRVLGRIPSTELVELSEAHSVSCGGESSIDRESTGIIVAFTGDFVCLTIKLQCTLLGSMPSFILMIFTGPHAVVKVIFLVDSSFGHWLIDERWIRLPWLSFAATIAKDWAENHSSKSKDTTNYTSGNSSASITVVTGTWTTSIRSTNTYLVKKMRQRQCLP